jgi:histidyl-tRNA synthetase
MSGYPEWLPNDRLVEQSFINLIREKFELFGFSPIETRAVEPISTLLAKGETDKEIYVLQRIQAEEDESDKGIGLHFDLTVPFARFIIENKNEVTFPLRRYQIQKAWRGERPGLGRYREFLQADIDIVDAQDLPVYNDLEIVQIASDIMTSLPIPDVQIFVNNRKLLEGFYRALGITAINEVLRSVDKLQKIGEKRVYQHLTENVGLSSNIAAKCLEIGSISEQNASTLESSVRSLGVNHELMEEGLYELSYILGASNAQVENLIRADLGIARGLDYYTGTVYEVKFPQFSKYPSIAAGGRYDNLVSDGSSRLPGVGISIGITRILGLVLREGVLQANRKTPTCVLVALVSDEKRSESLKIASSLRNRGIPCEVYPRALRYGKQIKYADHKGIPYVWFPSEIGQGDGEVRDIRSGIQVAANSNTWMPPNEDIRVQIQRNDDAFDKLLHNVRYN